MLERQSSNADIPSPLRVIKRGKSMQVLHSSPRKFSSGSVDHDPNRALTVVKRRKSHGRTTARNNQTSANQPVPGLGFEERSRSATVNSASSISWDPVTPKPRKVHASRRSSSFHVGRPPSPTFLTKLRSLSSRRTSLSLKPAHRRCSSRIPSNASDDSTFKSSEGCETTDSWDQSTKCGQSEEPPSFINDFETHSFDNQPFLDTQTPESSIPDPYMLIPHISITPESRSLTDGQSSIWAAIEISGQLSHPRVSDSSYSSAHPSAAHPFLPTHHCDANLSGYGYLYDVRVDILPTAEGSVIDLIGDATIRTISPGSSLLILAHIRLGPSNAQKHRASRRDPDNLIADLELQLGNVQTEYVHIRINYCHSGFPVFRNTFTEDGISASQTRLETTTTGIIKRLSPTSTWSPKPTTTSNPLFAIIASHWGPARANELMSRITQNRHNPRRAANWAGVGAAQPYRAEDTIRAPDRTGTAPPIPQRQASLKRLSPDPARKIWTELRQTSSGNRPAFHVSKANRLPAATTFVDAPSPPPIIRPESARPEPRSEVQLQRELIRETAVRNKRSIGADSLKSLVPSVKEMSVEGKENSSPVSPSPPGRQEMRFDGRKREGRWSLGNWW
ncbi:hypothetical protein F5Y13DRAFT_203317 [Hypoxylon sp. FL1857]|nr:hypothetical protein F5Y13DRAFT_203317 [Hypoxylon sp. FL1857]